MGTELQTGGLQDHLEPGSGCGPGTLQGWLGDRRHFHEHGLWPAGLAFTGHGKSIMTHLHLHKPAPPPSTPGSRHPQGLLHTDQSRPTAPWQAPSSACLQVSLPHWCLHLSLSGDTCPQLALTCPLPFWRTGLLSSSSITSDMLVTFSSRMVGSKGVTARCSSWRGLTPMWGLVS